MNTKKILATGILVAGLAGFLGGCSGNKSDSLQSRVISIPTSQTAVMPCDFRSKPNPQLKYNGMLNDSLFSVSVPGQGSTNLYYSMTSKQFKVSHYGMIATYDLVRATPDSLIINWDPKTYN